MHKLFAVFIMLLVAVPSFSAATGELGRAALSKQSLEKGWQLMEVKAEPFDTKENANHAIIHFNHAILLDSHSGPAWFAAGYWYSVNKQADEALKSYRRSLDYQPDYPSTHMNIGMLLLAKKDMQEALASLLKARDLAPERGVIHGNLARWYLVNKQVDKARAELALAEKYRDSIDPAYLEALKKYINKP